MPLVERDMVPRVRNEDPASPKEVILAKFIAIPHLHGKEGIILEEHRAGRDFESFVPLGAKSFLRRFRLTELGQLPTLVGVVGHVKFHKWVGQAIDVCSRQSTAFDDCNHKLGIFARFSQWRHRRSRVSLLRITASCDARVGGTCHVGEQGAAAFGPAQGQPWPVVFWLATWLAIYGKPNPH
jgi:hypothetical protein